MFSVCWIQKLCQRNFFKVSPPWHIFTYHFAAFPLFSCCSLCTEAYYYQKKNDHFRPKAETVHLPGGNHFCCLQYHCLSDLLRPLAEFIRFFFFGGGVALWIISRPKTARLWRPSFCLIAVSVLSSAGHCSTLLLQGTAWEAVRRTDRLPCLKRPPFHGCQGGPAALVGSPPCPPESRAEMEWCCRGGLHQHLGSPDNWRAGGGQPHRQETWFY